MGLSTAEHILNLITRIEALEKEVWANKQNIPVEVTSIVDDNRYKDVTRFEVIDKVGRVYVKYDVEVVESIQDEGRTLKMFIKDRDTV
jgi:hypothetical protein